MKKLYRSRKDIRFAGVCGGIAEYFKIDSTLVRLITLCAILFGGMGIMVYIVCAIIMPTAPDSGYKHDDDEEEDDRRN